MVSKKILVGGHPLFRHSRESGNLFGFSISYGRAITAMAVQSTRRSYFFRKKCSPPWDQERHPARHLLRRCNKLKFSMDSRFRGNDSLGGCPLSAGIFLDTSARKRQIPLRVSISHLVLFRLLARAAEVVAAYEAFHGQALHYHREHHHRVSGHEDGRLVGVVGQ